MTEFEKWLSEHGLVSLHPLLSEHDVDLDIIADLSEADLYGMGVSLGQRKRLLRAIVTLGSADSPLAGDSPRNTNQHTTAEPVPHLKGFSASAPERRQLTVLFCDLVGSTELSLELDLEDLRDALLDYQETVSNLIKANRGFIARYMGDGVLVYFGYPLAMEDDAYSAMLAAQDILTTFHQSAQRSGSGFKVRIGIATGLVVAGDIVGSGASEEHSVLGKTPNLAARLQGVAGPNQMVIDDQTWLLIRRRYTANKLENLTLKGFTKPVTAYEVPIQQPRSIFTQPVDQKLVGRKAEMQALQRYWRDALNNISRFVLVDGEPGIGKSRLIREFRHQLDDSAHRYIQWQCSPHAMNTAFFTIIQYLQETCGFKANDPLTLKRETVVNAATALALNVAEADRLAQVLSLAEQDGSAATTTPKERRFELIQLMIDMLTRIAAVQPTVLVIEDIHWIDPSTLELLQTLMQNTCLQPLMLIASCRPEFDLATFDSADLLRLPLRPLNDDECLELISEHGTLPHSLTKEILRKADGIPLYLEEIAVGLFEAAKLQLTADGATNAIPSSLQNLLMAKLDRLGPARELAQLAAVVGDVIDTELLQHLSGLSSDWLQRHLETLNNAGVLVHAIENNNERFRFQHALLQEIAYQTLLRDDRKRLHYLVGETIRDQQPELAASQPERVALQFGAADAAEDAIEYWHLAAMQASTLSANNECLAQLDAAIKLLPKLSSDSARDNYELELNIVHGSVLRGTKGPASDEVAQIYKRSLELCESLEKKDHLIPTLIGLYAFNLLRARYAEARDHATRLLSVATDSGDITGRMVGHRALGGVCLNTGELKQASDHLQKSRKLYDPARHDSSAYTVGVDHLQIATSFYCISLCLQGHPETAIRLHNEELQRATDFGHVHNLAQALGLGAFHASLSAHPEAENYCDRLSELADEFGFPVMQASAQLFKGSASYYRGSIAAALIEMKEGLEQYQLTGTYNYLPYFQMRIAECYLSLREFDSARDCLDQAGAGVERTGEYWCQAEWLRLSGEYEKLANCDHEAEKSYYRRAIADAETRGAMLWLLRSLLALRSTVLDDSEKQSTERKMSCLLQDCPELADSYFLKST